MVIAVGPRSSLVRRGHGRLPADADDVMVGVEKPGGQGRPPFRPRARLSPLLLLLRASASVVGFEVLESSRACVVKDVGIDGDNAALLTVAPANETNWVLTI